MPEKEVQAPIRLTNRTARALRRCALREQSVCRGVAVVLTLVLAGVSVALGVVWLPAVPLVLAGAVLLDALLLVVGRSRYLTLIGQAICTEAAARGIQDRGDEKRRRRQALSDLAGIRADMERLAREEPGSAPDEEDEDLLPAVERRVAARPPEPAREDTKRMQKAEAPARRRRRQAAFQVIQGEQTGSRGAYSGGGSGPEQHHKARH